jgi:hypothetical protein
VNNFFIENSFKSKLKIISKCGCVLVIIEKPSKIISKCGCVLVIIEKPSMSRI